jgi:hypothetical protein
MTQPEAAELIVHKATRECSMIEPHGREICGLIRERLRRQGNPPPTAPSAPAA